MPRRAQAAADVLAVQWQYASQGRSVASAALAGARRFVEWEHHPRGDHVDRASGARFYYHAHPAAERAAGEHGHFHLFVPAPGAPQELAHLVGLSIDAQGLPLRLFTTNRWVTGETWRNAGTLVRVLPRFALHASGRLAPVARWLAGMVVLYEDLVTELLYERDARLGRDDAALDDRTLHIVSERPVSLPHRLRSIEASPTTKETTHVPCA